ncbi:E3 ubiquitin-protein ligase FANCL isoform X2 [Battus philenor]
MEPLYPTYRDDYRKILIDDRTWLHVEVTPDGGATNINLIGQSEPWHDKLHTGLLNWDHDKDIVENIMSIFDLSGFPSEFPEVALKPDSDVIEKQICGICLSNELPDTPGVPQPLCQNNSCGVYFHRSCLYEWLIANAGGRPPAFGVATGTCPTCLHPIACSENNDR